MTCNGLTGNVKNMLHNPIISLHQLNIYSENFNDILLNTEQPNLSTFSLFFTNLLRPHNPFYPGEKSRDWLTKDEKRCVRTPSDLLTVTSACFV